VPFVIVFWHLVHRFQQVTANAWDLFAVFVTTSRQC
jgi:hypothetical protein